mmetsp:Transcript_4360/g.10667  ORF Transcript_4360/g.10667 Transcript_4360/m.10667 type:complete len:311 (-) Transcript_4360:1641-2573(-)
MRAAPHNVERFSSMHLCALFCFSAALDATNATGAQVVQRITSVASAQLPSGPFLRNPGGYHHPRVPVHPFFDVVHNPPSEPETGPILLSFSRPVPAPRQVLDDVLRAAPQPLFYHEIQERVQLRLLPVRLVQLLLPIDRLFRAVSSFVLRPSHRFRRTDVVAAWRPKRIARLDRSGRGCSRCTSRGDKFLVGVGPGSFFRLEAVLLRDRAEGRRLFIHLFSRHEVALEILPHRVQRESCAGRRPSVTVAVRDYSLQRPKTEFVARHRHVVPHLEMCLLGRPSTCTHRHVPKSSAVAAKDRLPRLAQNAHG